MPQFILKIFAFIVAVLAVGFSIYYLTGSLLKSKKEPIKKTTPSALEKQIKNGIHQPTGLIADDNLKLIIANCTGCHSAKLITQNQATREGWESIIRWMQKNQNLHDLGENEGAILDYLAEHYAPKAKGRRPPLENVDWYELEE